MKYLIYHDFSEIRFYATDLSHVYDAIGLVHRLFAAESIQYALCMFLPTFLRL